MSEESFNWSPEQMLEVTLNQPDDFLKIRETLSRIGVASLDEGVCELVKMGIEKGRKTKR